MDVIKDEILRIAKLFGHGYYRVKESGEFLEADTKARDFFGIPQDLEENDLKKRSIKDLYAMPAERDEKVEKLKNNNGKPVNGSLYLNINGEKKVLLTWYWWEENQADESTISGLVYDIDDSIFFPILYDDLPIGVYELDDENKIRHFNQKALEIFGYTNRQALIGEKIEKFYVDPNDMESFSEKVRENGFAQEIIKFIKSDKKVIELECSTKNLKQFNRARWGMLHEVTDRERYYNALNRLPTAYYYIDYTQKPDHETHQHVGIIAYCNDQFVNIIGEKEKKSVIGEDFRKYYASKEEGEELFKALDESDNRGMPLINFPFKLKKADNGQIVHITVDSHLVRENGAKGKVIGREGTIRDISKEVELREQVEKTKKQVEETEANLKKTTSDINKLIHTFLHPVIKFAGNTELLFQVGDILYQTLFPENYSKDVFTKKIEAKKIGQLLIKNLEEIQNHLNTIDENSIIQPAMNAPFDGTKITPITAKLVITEIQKIINVFQYSLNEEESEILLNRAVRDTALWILKELNSVQFFANNPTIPPVNPGFIRFLQDILFKYLAQSAKILWGETEAMKREVEALRSYIGMRKIRHFSFYRNDLGKILEENIERFTPVLLEEDIDIDYSKTGELWAEFSAHDIDRVICNLFHNVKKYSFSGKGRFTKIRARELLRDRLVEFYIESFGFPIKKEEIESGSIWEFGFRGEMAYASDRDGTGAGLADARDVVMAHHGKISISSKPAYDDGDPPKYKSPYITRISIQLPKFQEEKGVVR